MSINDAVRRGIERADNGQDALGFFDTLFGSTEENTAQEEAWRLRLIVNGSE